MQSGICRNAEKIETRVVATQAKSKLIYIVAHLTPQNCTLKMVRIVNVLLYEV